MVSKMEEACGKAVRTLEFNGYRVSERESCEGYMRIERRDGGDANAADVASALGVDLVVFSSWGPQKENGGVVGCARGFAALMEDCEVIRAARERLSENGFDSVILADSEIRVSAKEGNENLLGWSELADALGLEVGVMETWIYSAKWDRSGRRGGGVEGDWRYLVEALLAAAPV